MVNQEHSAEIQRHERPRYRAIHAGGAGMGAAVFHAARDSGAAVYFIIGEVFHGFPSVWGMLSCLYQPPPRKLV